MIRGPMNKGADSPWPYEYWEFEGDWYVSVPNSLLISLNTEEAAQMFVEMHKELAAIDNEQPDN